MFPRVGFQFLISNFISGLGLVFVEVRSYKYEREVAE